MVDHDCMVDMMGPGSRESQLDTTSVPCRAEHRAGDAAWRTVPGQWDSPHRHTEEHHPEEAPTGGGNAVGCTELSLLSEFFNNVTEKICGKISFVVSIVFVSSEVSVTP